MQYLYVIHIPVYKENDLYLMDRAAALDIMAHRKLLPPSTEIIVAAPVLVNDDARLVVSALDVLEGITIVPLRYINSLAEGFLKFSHNRNVLEKAVVNADFIHTGCGGFPYFFSPCYWAHRLARKHKKPLLFVMDCDLVGKLEVDQVRLATNPLKKLIWHLFAKLSWHLYTSCLSTASVTFLLGQGVVNRYGSFARNSLTIYQPIVGTEFLIPQPELEAKIDRLVQEEICPSFCFAGRLAPEKGLEILLQAAGMLGDTPFFINVYGDGPNKEACQNMAKDLKIGEKVKFHGNLEWGDTLFSELKNNHIQIIPHLTLEMTRNVFDGMASGCALVVSDTPALKSLLDDSKAGIPYETGNADELARILALLLADKKKIATFMQSGVEFVRNNHRDAHVLRRLEFLSVHFPNLFGERGEKP